LGLNTGYNIINKPDLKAFIAAGAGLAKFQNNTHTSEISYNATDASTIVNKMSELTYFIDAQAGVIVKKKFMGWLSYNLPTELLAMFTQQGIYQSFSLVLGISCK
jgi:hypothetical protein